MVISTYTTVYMFGVSKKESQYFFSARMRLIDKN